MRLWLAMFAMSAISIAGIGIYEYKKKKSIRK